LKTNPREPDTYFDPITSNILILYISIESYFLI
jgi:hypothetical protein